METVVERPAAMDVHKEQVTACVRVPGEGRSRVQHVEEFPNTVAGLLTLRGIRPATKAGGTPVPSLLLAR